MSNASSDRPDLLHSTIKADDSITHGSTTASQATSDSFISSLNQTVRASEKFVFSSMAIPGRIVSSSSPSLISSVPSMNVPSQKLEDCPKVHDRDKREAQFALRTTDLSNWKQSAEASSSSTGESNTDIDPKPIQHWAVVIYFPDGDETYLYEAWRGEKGRLQPGRARYVNKEIFDKAEFIGTAMTSPFELLEKAKQVPTGEEYSVLNNNCQTWLMNYLQIISPELFELFKKIISKHLDKTLDRVLMTELILTAGTAALLGLSLIFKSKFFAKSYSEYKVDIPVTYFPSIGNTIVL